MGRGSDLAALAAQRLGAIYDITSAGYLERARSMYIEGVAKNRNFLIYSALELRCGIERLLFEYLVLIKRDDLSKSMEKIYLANQLKNEILAIEPHFLQKVDFINLIYEAWGSIRRVPIPDLEKISATYGRLGAYLHAPKRPSKSAKKREWWFNLEETIKEGLKDLELYTQRSAHISLNEKGLAHLEDLIKGIKTRAQIISEMKSTS